MFLSHFRERRRALVRPALEALEERLVQSASPILFTLSSAQSTLALAGNVNGTDIAEQTSGSLTTSYTGTITTKYDPVAATLLFVAPINAGDPGTLNANDGGTYSPDIGGFSGSAPADYGGYLDEGIFGSVDVAVRDLQASISTTSPVALTGGPSSFRFAANQVLTLIGTSNADYFGYGFFAGTQGNNSLADLSSNNSAVAGTFQDQGNGTYLLIVPIDVTISTQLAGQDATFFITGSLRASATLPVVDLNGAGPGNDNSATFVAGSGSVSIVTADATLSRATTANLTSARLTLTNHPDGSAERLDVTLGTSGLSKSYDATTGTLTLTGSASLATYQQVLRTATYLDTSAAPNISDRLITVTVNDGTNSSLVHTTTVHIQPITGLSLAGTSVPEFRATGTAIGAFSTTETGSGHTYTYSLVSGTGFTDNASFATSGNRLVTADAFDFAARSSYSVRVRTTDENGKFFERAFTITIVDDPALTRSGRTLTVMGTSGNDTFIFVAGAVRHSMALNGVALAVDSSSVDSVVYQNGGGSDTVYLTGGSGVKVQAAGAGSGTAYLYDNAGNNTFVGKPAQAYLLQGGAVVNEADNFKAVYVFDTAGKNDTAVLYDVPASASTFVGAAGYAYLTGPGYLNATYNFKSAYAFASAGSNDSAVLYGAAVGGNTFVGASSYAYLVGTGYLNASYGFHTAIAYAAVGGNDSALLYDAPTGTNTFVGTPTYAYFSGPGYLNDTFGFKTVVAYATVGGDDTAILDAAPSGANTFVGAATYAYLQGAGYLNDVFGFKAVHAYGAGGGSDTALLYASTGSDVFSGLGADGTLSGPGYLVGTTAFDVVSLYNTSTGQGHKSVGAVDYLFQAFGTWL